MSLKNYVICGLPNSGQKQLFDLLKQTLSKNYYFNEIGLSILDSPIKENTINFNLFDLTRIQQLSNTTKFIICIRDIRDILCEKFIFNGSETYVNDWNCRFMIDDLPNIESFIGSTTSFGLRFYYEFIKNNNEINNTLFITYDELISDPISIQLKLLDFELDFDIDFDNIDNLNQYISPIDSQMDVNEFEYINRLSDQVNQFPDIIEAVSYFNFDNLNKNWFKNIYDPKKSNIIQKNKELEINKLYDNILIPKKQRSIRANKLHIFRQIRNQIPTKRKKIGTVKFKQSK